jgi:threonyl-tRNA synthetase
MLSALNFLKHVYSVFGFSFQLVLSTRPEKYMGEINMWNEAEKVIYYFRNIAVIEIHNEELHKLYASLNIMVIK